MALGLGRGTAWLIGRRAWLLSSPSFRIPKVLPPRSRAPFPSLCFPGALLPFPASAIHSQYGCPLSALVSLLPHLPRSSYAPRRREVRWAYKRPTSESLLWSTCCTLAWRPPLPYFTRENTQVCFCNIGHYFTLILFTYFFQWKKEKKKTFIMGKRKPLIILNN